jgi:hypothetical protein
MKNLLSKKLSFFRLFHALIAVMALVPNAAIANPILFQDSFSGGLSQWTGRNGGSHQGQIIADPLNAQSSVLNFNGLNYSGDIFTASAIPVAGISQVLLSFDYLGLAQLGSVPGNLGGFLGIGFDLVPNGGAWLAGTEPSAVNGLGFTGIEIIDDGSWHHYQIDLTPMITANNISAFHLMVEDWGDAHGVAGDSYFDNITVSGPDSAGSVPDGGSTLNLSLVAIVGFCFLSRKAGVQVIRRRGELFR